MSKRILRTIEHGIVLLAALTTLGGCATHSLWTGALLEIYHEPSMPNRLALFDAPEKGDLLAEYDELSPWRDTPQRRAYFIAANSSRNEARRTPRFKSLSVTNGLFPVPVYETSLSARSGESPCPIFGIAATNENRFRVVRHDNGIQGTFYLPTYRSPTDRLKCVALTPVTLAVDATIVGGFIVYYYLNIVAGSPGGGRLWPSK